MASPSKVIVKEAPALADVITFENHAENCFKLPWVGVTRQSAEKTPASSGSIQCASSQLLVKKGAGRTLCLVCGGVMETVCLMPLKQTRNEVARAHRLMSERTYYGANLALKGAKAGVIIDSAALVASE